MARGTAEVRTSLWRLPAMRALVGATALGFASYCLTLASLPAYAVAGGAAADTAGVVTAVLLLVTVAVQSAVPALTARYGVGPVLAAGLVALGAPSPLYAVDDGLLWLSAVSAVRGSARTPRTTPGTSGSASTGAAASHAIQAACPPSTSATPAGTATRLGTAMARP